MSDILDLEDAQTTGDVYAVESDGTRGPAILRNQEVHDKYQAGEEAKKRKKNSLFQTLGGSSGIRVFSVGARDTYFGN